MRSATIERLCVWSGIVAVTLFFLGFLFSHFIPPPSPSLPMNEVVAHYQRHANGIRAGMVGMMISGCFVAPLVGVISALLRRISGVSSALIYGQIAAGALGAVFFILGALVFLVAAFRPERAPEITYTLNDMAWIMTVIPWSPAFIQNILIGTAILSDRAERPIFPRWLAYLNFWVALGFLPGGLLPFFKSGPFAWNGVFVFWLAATVFVLWFVVMTAMLLRAIALDRGIFYFSSNEAARKDR